MTRINDNLRRLAWGSLFVTGFILSPISWWNDAVVNLPIAYLAAQLAAIFDQRLFLFAFVGTYWATNLVGLISMHVSARKLLRKTEPRISLGRFAPISLLYTLLIVAAQFKWIRSPLITAQRIHRRPPAVQTFKKLGSKACTFHGGRAATTAGNGAGGPSPSIKQNRE